MGATVLAVPVFVSGQYHRAAIEALASRVAGHPVRIDGKIELSLLPEPQLIADKVTIGAPDGAHTTAAVLKLDLKTSALLTGRLSASRLTLEHADIDLPWPVPGGAGALAPPPWLASLHARLVDGRVHIGALDLTHAHLSFFTGGPHSVLAASGSAQLHGSKVRLRLILTRIENGRAQVQMSLGLADDKTTALHLHGSFGTDGVLTGRLVASASATAGRRLPVVALLPKAPFHLAARVEASGAMILLSGLTAQCGKAQLAGQAAIDLRPAALLRVTLHGDSLDLDRGLALLRGETLTIPVAAQLDLRHVSLAGVHADRLDAALTIDRHGTTLQSLTLTGPHGARLDLSGTMNRAAHMAGRFRLSSPQARSLAAWGATLTTPKLDSVLHRLSLAGAPFRLRGRVDAEPHGLVSVTDVHGLIGAGDARSDFMGSLAIGRAGAGRQIALGLDFRRLALREADIETIGRMIAARRASLAAATASGAGASGGTHQGGKPDPDKAPATKAGTHSVQPPKEVKPPLPPAAHHGRTGPAPAPSFTLRLVASRLAILNGHRTLFGHNLLLDADFGRTLAVHALGVSLGHALFLAHGTMTAGGRIGAARLVASGPDAAKTVASLARLADDPPGMRQKTGKRQKIGKRQKTGRTTKSGIDTDDLIDGPFAISAETAGRVNRLATSADATIGALHLTARPEIDLGTSSASGPVALQAPSAIDLLRKLGIAADAAWPGAGSVGLNAEAFVNAKAVGLADFVLSFGATTGSGRLALTRSGPPNLTGTIRFGTLAVPAPQRLLALARAGLAGGLDLHLGPISAASVQHAGTTVAKTAAFTLSLGQGKLSRTFGLRVGHAVAGGGRISGGVTMTARASSTPATLTVKAALDRIDAARLADALAGAGVAIPLRHGTLTVKADLDATGATPRRWLDTLSGTLAGSGKDLVIDGLDLAASGKALGASLQAIHPRPHLPPPDRLTAALMHGRTAFARAQLASTVRHGAIHVDNFSITGKSGELGLGGHVDLAHDALDLTATATPGLAGLDHTPGFVIRLTGQPGAPRRSVSTGKLESWLRLWHAARQAMAAPPPLPLPPPFVAPPAEALPLPPPHVAPAAAGH